MDAENPGNNEIEYIQGPPNTGKTVRALREAHNAARHNWRVFFVSCEETVENLHDTMDKEGIASSDRVTFEFVEKKPGFIKEVIELCRKKRPDLLVLDGGQPGVNDLRLLSAAGKELNMLMIVTQRPSPTLK